MAQLLRGIPAAAFANEAAAATALEAVVPSGLPAAIWPAASALAPSAAAAFLRALELSGIIYDEVGCSLVILREHHQLVHPEARHARPKALRCLRCSISWRRCRSDLNPLSLFMALQL